MLVKILQDTSIAGEPVFADEVVDVDAVTYRQLRLCGRASVVEEPASEPAKPALPKFTRKPKQPVTS